jgi:hypothetical protein
MLASKSIYSPMTVRDEGPIWMRKRTPKFLKADKPNLGGQV